MSDTVANLGKLIEGDEPRDAIHIAVAPVIAGEMLWPGQHIGLDDAGNAVSTIQPVGIVDPFLAHRVSQGAEVLSLPVSGEHNLSGASLDTPGV